MQTATDGRSKPEALALLSGERPRNVGWRQAAGLLFGDWGTSRLYVLGLAFFFARGTSVWLIAAMSLLILAVGWAYTQICRIYPDGGGVYTAAKHKSQSLAVVGALLLFADYVVTASLSSLDAFHYFNLPHTDSLWAVNSPGLWAMVSIITIGGFNLLGPKHTGAFAIAAAVGMMFITLLITAFALPQVNWSAVPQRIGHLSEPPRLLWLHFVGIVLALSGVEAIGNLTGVMKKPVARTAGRAIWLVAIEVAVFNILLALAMVSRLDDGQGAEHKEDMLAFLASAYVGGWGEWAVRAIGGVLLLSACNTVITDMISVQYLMSRDGELPAAFQKLNRFGVPWVPAVIATAVPCLVLLVSHDLEHLAALYAIGVVGAVAINITLVSTHPRLRSRWRKGAALSLGALLGLIWVTLALTKLHALAFVTIVMIVGLSARQLTRYLARRRPDRPSLLRRAIADQLQGANLARRRILIGTYGSDLLATAALEEARRLDAALVVCFIRQVKLSYKYDEKRLTIDTDPAALRAFSRFLELGHQAGVPVIPVYDSGPDAAELLAENAATWGCDRVLIGTSRQGVLYHLIKGHFQRRLEALLPPEIPVQVISPQDPSSSGDEPEPAEPAQTA
ncbi:MAG TPA: APC family permease [Tepidisphaeraceae bacterium]|nr:APC family permease [Tepidisphaeraceae bacterium]